MIIKVYSPHAHKVYADIFDGECCFEVPHSIFVFRYLVIVILLPTVVDNFLALEHGSFALINKAARILGLVRDLLGLVVAYGGGVQFKSTKAFIELAINRNE